MNAPLPKATTDRGSEWFVPKFGPPRFRYFAGLLFLPYTGMVLSYAVIGSLLANEIHWDRLAAIAFIYLLGLGVAAHALDAIGSKGQKPWGEAFSRRQLWAWALTSLALAYGVAIFYMVRHVPSLWSVAVLEGFFVFAYNLEWFGGRFHTDSWFAFSWGFLPVLAGHIMQTNGLSLAALLVGSSMALFSQVEIRASRPYKELKRCAPTLTPDERERMERYEAILRCLSVGVILLAAGLLAGRWMVR